MKEQDIERILKQIESWMMMTCESCAMPDKIRPLLEKIRKILESEAEQDKDTARQSRIGD
ncbi:MAG: hypothetical protein ABRQ23_06350 [Syntrophomonadaceae bacterium]